MKLWSPLWIERLRVPRYLGAFAVIVWVSAAFALPCPARAAVSGEVQDAIVAMVNSAIAGEDAKGLSDAINDLCAAHPDIKQEIVAAVANELASKRPPGYCLGKAAPCVDLDSVMNTLRINILVTSNTAAGVSRRPERDRFVIEDNRSECGAGGCSSKIVEPSPSKAASAIR